MVKSPSVLLDGELQKKLAKSLEKILPRHYSSQSLAKIVGKNGLDLDTEAINKAINEPFWDLLDRGGKRWRPALFLIILDLLGKDAKDFVDFAIIFELIHNATLMIDDIEDSSSLRRGKKAVHLIYGVDISINAANTLYFLPLKILDNYKDSLSQETILKVYQTYLQEMINLSLGQATDIAWHRGLVDDLKISVDQYLQMCAFKTGCLARMACKMAVIVAGGSDQLVVAFGKLGESLGIVFQIQDDILNITKSELSNKKGLGEDITEGKISLPVIYAVSELSKSKQQRLIKILNMHTRDSNLKKEAIELIGEGKGIELAQKKMQLIFNQTWNELINHLQENTNTQKLYQLAQSLIERKI